MLSFGTVTLWAGWFDCSRTARGSWPLSASGPRRASNGSQTAPQAATDVDQVKAQGDGEHYRRVLGHLEPRCEELAAVVT